MSSEVRPLDHGSFVLKLITTRL